MDLAKTLSKGDDMKVLRGDEVGMSVRAFVCLCMFMLCACTCVSACVRTYVYWWPSAGLRPAYGRPSAGRLHSLPAMGHYGLRGVNPQCA